MTSSLQVLADTVNNLTELACQLEQALNQQLDHLTQAAVQDLSTSSDQVATLTRALNSAEQQRLSVLAALGQDSTSTFAPEQLFAQHPLQDQVVSDWQRCFTALQACQQLNQQAGVHIKVQAKQTEAALAVLLNTNHDHQLYNLKGKTRLSNHGQRLGQA